MPHKKKKKKQWRRQKDRKRFMRMQPNRSSEKAGRGMREGIVWWWERQIIYPNYYYHFTTSCPLSAHCFILRSLSPLWVMSGSNWWILLTFPVLHFYVCVSVCMCVCHRFLLRLCTLQYSLLLYPAQTALLTIFCYVMWQIGPTLSERRI